MIRETNENLLLHTDSYKVGHWPQYPPGTEHVYSYFESRGGSYPKTMFFGLQYIIERHLMGGFTMDDINEAEQLYREHFGSASMFNYDGWKSMLRKYDGALPVRIKAVPEGTVVPVSNVLMTIENTDPEFPWLTNYLETILSQVWYPTTVATISWYVRQKIAKYLAETGDETGIDFKLHDFGFRGASSLETAALGGAAHLTSFMGTDTVPALTLLRDYYGPSSDLAGFSVPASEHSTMTAWGKERETEAYANMIDTYGDYPYYSVVSDSYDIYKAVEEIWGGALHDQILAAGGTLVIRPDSGDPAEVMLKLLDLIAEKFGHTTNEKGFKVLHPKVRLIWGDGLEPRTIESILFRMRLYGWSAENTVFGMGGGLLQKVNRDTQKFAFKASQVTVNGERRDVWKTPVGDTTKFSKRGRLGLVRTTAGPHVEASYATIPVTGHYDDIVGNILETVFENGAHWNTATLDQVRERNGMLATSAASV